jgi:hypothetical protein
MIAATMTATTIRSVRGVLSHWLVAAARCGPGARAAGV